jgi:hypothetical protein
MRKWQENKMGEYLYAVTSTNDNDTKPSWIGRYTDALSAVKSFELFVDHGMANEYRTVNLSEPSGKMHTKILYRNGKVGGK